FFSSRRRHTSFSRDWSSDVCSSDLAMRADPGQVVSDPYEWLEESREIMQLYVYTDDIKAGVLRSERRDSPLPEFALDADYLARMQSIAEDRLALAGLRLALILRIPLSVNGGG